jgi:hypothetical protein
MSPGRRKWLWIGGFWAVQAAATLLLWPVFGGLFGIFEPELLGSLAVVLASIMAFQATLVLPVNTPPDGGGHLATAVHQGRLGRCVAGGLAAGLLCGWLFYAGYLLINAGQDDLAADWLPGFVWPAPVWAGVLISPVGMLLLWRVSRRGMQAGLSFAIAGLVAAMLVGAAVGGVFSLLMVLGLGMDHFPVACGAVLLSWLVATPLIASYTGRFSSATRLHRTATVLFGGTIITTAALIPLDVMVRRKTDCYCAEGTFFALSLCWAAGLIVLGPAVFLLPARRHERRLMRGECLKCGYDLRATPGVRCCPECGSAR